MAGLSDLFGANGVLEQLLLWGVVNQVISSLGSPAFTALQQDIMARNPDVVLSPQVLAEGAARYLIDEAQARGESAKSGTDAARFNLLFNMARVRLSPADLAEGVLRSYVTMPDAVAEARPQGVDARQLGILRDLAGDAPGADQLAQALRRGIIKTTGRGAGSTSYEQGIAETRLHDKWGPVLRELSKAILSPPDAASAVVRNFMPEGEAQAKAALSGVDAADFAIMRHLSADAPAPGQLAEALRRKVIPEAGTGANVVSFKQGIAEGRLGDKWEPMIKALAQLWPTPTAALDALLKGQVTHAQAVQLYTQFGGDPAFFDLLYNTQGEAPTPLELITMANRGFIPWTGTGPQVVSYEQGFHEGRWRNKWEPVYRHFAVYVPPESTVVTLLSRGAITPALAAQLLAKQGMDAQLIAAYLDEAHTEALSDYRGATVATVLTSYHERVISAADAKVILESLHVTPSAVGLLLAYIDAQRDFAALNNAITRVRTLFANRKITVTTARASLVRLKVPSQNIEPMIAAWEVENSITVKVLTEAQIIAAVENRVMTEAEGMIELENIGYTPFDAWVLMSIKNKGPMPNKPAQGPAPPQAQVVGGTT
jgi:hypothetical protein